MDSFFFNKMPIYTILRFYKKLLAFLSNELANGCPRSVIEVTHLIFRFYRSVISFLFVLLSNCFLNGFKVFSMLKPMSTSTTVLERSVSTTFI